MDLYAENILEHAKNPRHQDAISDVTIAHEEINHSCGDAVTLSLQIKDDAIQAVSWKGTGCAISQAGMSILSEELVGKSTKEITDMKKDDVYELLGVPIGTRRMKCALLCLHTVKNALRVAEGKPAQSWLDTVEIEGD